MAEKNIIVSGGVRYRKDDADRFGVKPDSKADAEAVADNRRPTSPAVRRNARGSAETVVSSGSASAPGSDAADAAAGDDSGK